MWYTAEIVLKSYLPTKLEEGMLFVNKISVGIIDPYVELWHLEDDFPENIDLFMSINGAPVNLFIIDEDGEILANPEEIGLWDVGEESEELYEISLEEINFLLREFDGAVEVQYCEDEDNEDVYLPVYYDDLVVLRLPNFDE
tara:strand:+ start:419 stop:844 length:426 start_codon:yes stop_codon:yes gene_type:complete